MTLNKPAFRSTLEVHILNAAITPKNEKSSGNTVEEYTIGVSHEIDFKSSDLEV